MNGDICKRQCYAIDVSRSDVPIFIDCYLTWGNFDFSERAHFREYQCIVLIGANTSKGMVEIVRR